jgi:hypothetical protein
LFLAVLWIYSTILPAYGATLNPVTTCTAPATVKRCPTALEAAQFLTQVCMASMIVQKLCNANKHTIPFNQVYVYHCVFLTQNSSYLPISNATWSGPLATLCSATDTQYTPSLIISSFPACNYFASTMPLGALVSDIV